MRLIYRMLWFEDNQRFFESLDHEGIKRHLDGIGFDVEVIQMTGDQDLQVILKEARKADLIVMDYGLEESHFGDQLIKEIRNGSINTQVVFYSARGVSELRRLVFEKELDGVYFGSRNEISQDVLPIIDSTIKKVLDLENVRGLVMAELGELDSMMNKIIIEVHDSSEENGSFVKGKIKKRLEEQQKSTAKLLEKVDAATIQVLLESLDSNKRCNIVMSICKKFGLASHKEQLGVFDGEILFPRNCMGHGTPEETEKGLVFSHGEKEFVYNEESSANLRNCFRKFAKQLSELFSEVSAAIKAQRSEGS